MGAQRRGRRPAGSVEVKASCARGGGLAEPLGEGAPVGLVQMRRFDYVGALGMERPTADVAVALQHVARSCSQPAGEPLTARQVRRCLATGLHAGAGRATAAAQARPSGGMTDGTGGGTCAQAVQQWLWMMRTGQLGSAMLDRLPPLDPGTPLPTLDHESPILYRFGPALRVAGQRRRAFTTNPSAAPSPGGVWQRGAHGLPRARACLRGAPAPVTRSAAHAGPAPEVGRGLSRRMWTWVGAGMLWRRTWFTTGACCSTRERSALRRPA